MMKTTPRWASLLGLLLLLASVLAPAAHAALTYQYEAAGDKPVSASSYTASGTATLTLGFAPAVGTNLTVVENTGLGFIAGAFSNLPQGQAVTLSYGGNAYRFVANYYGGTGNDLVLQWASVRAMAWGLNNQGQLGNGNQTNSSVPVKVNGSGVLAGHTVTVLSAGNAHSLALCSDGTVAAWGLNSNGQLGNGNTQSSLTPIQVTQTGVLAGKTVVSVAAGYDHSLALCSDGTVAAWGGNGRGQLGNGGDADTNSLEPVLVTRSGVLEGKTVVAISAGNYDSLALCSDGTLAAWGYNGAGELGNGDSTGANSSVPVQVTQTGVLAGKTVVAISAAVFHSLALCSDGTLAAWGYNGDGQLGNNSNTNTTVPVQVTQTGVLAGKTVVAISAQGYHSLALCNDGTVAAWGLNGFGELGDGSTTDRSAPVLVTQSGVLAGKTVVAVKTGLVHSLALCADGAIAAWGDNEVSQLGNNTTDTSSVPVLVDTSALADGERFTDVTSGAVSLHNLALVAFVATAGDTTPPVLATHADVGPVEATSPQGATVTYDPATATDDSGDPPTITYSNDSGTGFAIGDTTVTVTATDAAENSSTTTFTVTVVDTTAPVVTPPPDQVATADGSGSAVVTYPPATATDSGSGVATITYSQNSGTSFPEGVTTVTVTATDGAGNAGTATFLVTVLDPRLALPVATGVPVEGAGQEGTGVPAGAKFRTLGIPGEDAIPDGFTGGAAVFRGTFQSPSGGLQTGVFGLGGSTPLVAKTGDVASGTGGRRYATLGEPVGRGGTAFYGTLTGAAPNLGLWSNAFPDAEGQLQLVARVGDVVPGLPSARYSSLLGSVLNTGQHLFWAGRLAGPGIRPANEWAIFEMSDTDDGPEMVLRFGQQITVNDQPATIRSFVVLDAVNIYFGDGLPLGMTGFDTGRLDGGAMVPTRLQLADGRIALAAVSAGAPVTPIAVTRGAVPGISGTVWGTLGYPVAAPSGMMAFRGTLAAAPGSSGAVAPGTSQVLFVQRPGKGILLPTQELAIRPWFPETAQLELLARQGDDAPELRGLKLGGFSDPYLNRVGDAMYFTLLTGSGVTAKNQVALYWQLAEDGTASLVARAGGAAPGIAGAQIASFTGAALPASFGPAEPKRPVFMATLQNAPGASAVTAATNSALWAVDTGGEIRLLARTGMTLNGKTLRTIGAFRFVSTSQHQARAAAVSPHVIFLATYTDNTQAIVQVDVPASVPEK